MAKTYEPTFADVLRKWENRAALARYIGQPYDTVRKWEERNHVPPEYGPMVRDALAEIGFNMPIEEWEMMYVRKAFPAINGSRRRK